MSDPISRIELKLRTTHLAGSTTNGHVYLGIAGREYAVRLRKGHDFQPSAAAVSYIFGEDANVMREEDNDPRTPWQTDANNISWCPLYLRFTPQGDDDNWNIDLAELIVRFRGATPGSIVQEARYRLLAGSKLWLGAQRGQFLYFPVTPHSSH